MTILTPESCRAGRAILKWSVRNLGAQSGVSFNTISLFENGRPMRTSTAIKIINAFAAQGVEITNGDGTGARLKHRKSD